MHVIQIQMYLLCGTYIGMIDRFGSGDLIERCLQPQKLIVSHVKASCIDPFSDPKSNLLDMDIYCSSYL